MKSITICLILLTTSACSSSGSAAAPSAPAAKTPAGSDAAALVPRGHPLKGLPTRTRAWPGLQSPAEREKQRPLADALVAAMNAGDQAGITRHRNSLIAAMGRYVGEPEEVPLYGAPIDTAATSSDTVETIWTREAQKRLGKHPWDNAVAAVAAGNVPQRLRTMTRIARANLHVYESNMPNNEASLTTAVAAAEYILTVQASNGVFGYPYDPTATEGLRAVAARFVAEARKKGFDVAANGWIIDDLQRGDLNFDNAQSANFLLHVYALTGDVRYLRSAIRAGEWAMTRKLGSNYNYNGFNGQLLARLYRVTGERRFLDRARSVFEYGVMSGQLENGRWFDQHNAKIQYHAIMMSQLVEFYLALRLANDRFATPVQSSIERGLDNMAREMTQFGSSNVHELLAVDALIFGSTTLGPRKLWSDALNVDINFLTKQLWPKLEPTGYPVPEPLATYILFTRGRGEHGSGIDSTIGPVKPVKR